MQRLANVESVPASSIRGEEQSSISASSLSSNLAELVQGEGVLFNEFPIHIDDDDFIMPCNDGPVTCNFEEQLLVAAMPNSNMCANSNDCSHDHRFGLCGNALHVETDNTNMDYSLDTLENWLDATSLSNMECSDTVHSNTYQYDSHCLDYHVIGHLHENMDLNVKVTNSAFISYSPSNADGDVPMRFSGSADYCFRDVASLFAAIAGAPALDPNLLLPLSSSEATAIHMQQARSSSPSLYETLKAAHSMPKTRAIKNAGNCEAKEGVSILVESSTPAIDDGYRWCKYGQKNIKDQMHPRCYYKCAQHNCPVKKQTESSSNMQGYVLITYFGKHNH